MSARAAPARAAAPAGQPARRAAAALIVGVTERQKTLAELTAPGGPLEPLSPPERARATAIATGVLRRLVALDAVLAPMLRRPPAAPARAALRIAAWEMLVDGVPPHAAVDGAVRQVAGGRQAHLKGLVNAVARRVAREGAAALDTAPAPRLPAWLEAPVAASWGRDAAAAIAAVHAVAPPLDLTPRDPAGAAALAEALGALVLPTGTLRLAQGRQVSALPGYDAGQWWVQDAAAALPVRLLGDVSGLRVVDLCAAPGGKTMQLAAAGARVTAVDAARPRMARLAENLARTGLTAGTVVADALAWTPRAAPDIVVLDAPCSATGTLRRHPDLPHARPDPDLAPLIELQAALIDRALGWLAPGGRLLYCTCSLLPEEGEDQARAARARHPGTGAAAVAPPGVAPEWWTQAGDLRLRPDYWADRGGMDGFFAAVLRKPDPA